MDTLYAQPDATRASSQCELVHHGAARGPAAREQLAQVLQAARHRKPRAQHAERFNPRNALARARAEERGAGCAGGGEAQAAPPAGVSTVAAVSRERHDRQASSHTTGYNSGRHLPGRTHAARWPYAPLVRPPPPERKGFARRTHGAGASRSAYHPSYMGACNYSDRAEYGRYAPS